MPHREHIPLGHQQGGFTMTYVVIHGMHTSNRTPVEYVEHIVYGNPRIDAVLVGSHFVALCEFPDTQDTAADYTLGRMGSFPHGAMLTLDRDVAIREFGAWVYHYAPGTIAGFAAETAATQNLFVRRPRGRATARVSVNQRRRNHARSSRWPDGRRSPRSGGVSDALPLLHRADARQ
jgi:hypothetical protein